MAPFFATGDRTTCRSLVRRSGSPRSSWRDVFRTIRALGERGITILLVEQNVAMSLKVSQRAYVLETGRIVLSGTRDERVRQAHLGL